MKKWSVGLTALAALGLSACGSTKISCDTNRDYFEAVEYPSLEGDIEREDAYNIPRGARPTLEESSCLHVPPVNARLMQSAPAGAETPAAEQPTPKTIDEALAQ